MISNNSIVIEVSVGIHKLTFKKEMSDFTEKDVLNWNLNKLKLLFLNYSYLEM